MVRVPSGRARVVTGDQRRLLRAELTVPKWSNPAKSFQKPCEPEAHEDVAKPQLNVLIS